MKIIKWQPQNFPQSYFARLKPKNEVIFMSVSEK